MCWDDPVWGKHTVTVLGCGYKGLEVLWRTILATPKLSQVKQTWNFQQERAVETTWSRITLYVQWCGPGFSSTNQVLRWAADPHVTSHIVHSNCVCTLVEVHRTAALSVGPAVLWHWRVSFTRADEQGTAPLLHCQGLHLHFHFFWWNYGAIKKGFSVNEPRKTKIQVKLCLHVTCRSLEVARVLAPG